MLHESFVRICSRASCCLVSRWSRIVLQTSDGDHVAISPTIPSNAKRWDFVANVMRMLCAIAVEVFGVLMVCDAWRFVRVYRRR